MKLDLEHAAFIDLDTDATYIADSLTNLTYLTKGGFALVYRATIPDGTQVAVKVLKPANHFRESSYRKFLQEVAFQTALDHPAIVSTLGFCSIPVSKLLAATPPDILVPEAAGKADGGAKAVRGAGKGAPAARAAQEWFAERGLDKCWALVLELMPFNLFDILVAAIEAKDAPAPPQRPSNSGAAKPPPRPSNSGAAKASPAAASSPLPGGPAYSDVQALVWLIEAADAMAYLHSRRPLLIHRDVKPENLLLRWGPDGLLHAKLSDLGLMVAVDDQGNKVPPPQLLRPPGTRGTDLGATPERGSNNHNPGAFLRRVHTAWTSATQSGQPGTPPQPQPQVQAPAGALPATPAAATEAQADAAAFLSTAIAAATPPAASPPATATATAGARAAVGPVPAAIQSHAITQAATGAAAGTGLGTQHVLSGAPQAPRRGSASGAVGSPARSPADPAAASGGGALSPEDVATRVSETGSAKVSLQQVNSLLRHGKAASDFMPDMFSMTFRLTGQCGSVCYMSPEVARELPYNQKVDVFSFGCMAYELLTRKLLSETIVEGSDDAVVEYLGRVAWGGWRPDLPPAMPKDLKLLLSLCWHREPRLRPNFPTIAARLRETLAAVAGPSMCAMLSPTLLPGSTPGGSPHKASPSQSAVSTPGLSPLAPLPPFQPMLPLLSTSAAGTSPAPASASTGLPTAAPAPSAATPSPAAAAASAPSPHSQQQIRVQLEKLQAMKRQLEEQLRAKAQAATRDGSAGASSSQSLQSTHLASAATGPGAPTSSAAAPGAAPLPSGSPAPPVPPGQEQSQARLSAAAHALIASLGPGAAPGAAAGAAAGLGPSAAAAGFATAAAAERSSAPAIGGMAGRQGGSAGSLEPPLALAQARATTTALATEPGTQAPGLLAPAGGGLPGGSSPMQPPHAGRISAATALMQPPGTFGTVGGCNPAGIMHESQGAGMGPRAASAASGLSHLGQALPGGPTGMGGTAGHSLPGGGGPHMRSSLPVVLGAGGGGGGGPGLGMGMGGHGGASPLVFGMTGAMSPGAGGSGGVTAVSSTAFATPPRQTPSAGTSRKGSLTGPPGASGSSSAQAEWVGADGLGGGTWGPVMVPPGSVAPTPPRSEARVSVSGGKADSCGGGCILM
ncbi:hypothetical protein HYH03_000082 [Edaphochlamys debaryana]|uniref:Protein kinase domain-containing protein n=1 Tax=Edaphochlamys debaryana TaxID=47281 RepID=A0A835YGW9_9CHLO|nr:hypothetical protein HYH03_000082 [Edaphochlamys debaryana]|eukprot:KAG2501577.1 hypothetical protein HYH03_000082 [Edaphochlamys debaryana]